MLCGKKRTGGRKGGYTFKSDGGQKGVVRRGVTGINGNVGGREHNTETGDTKGQGKGGKGAKEEKNKKERRKRMNIGRNKTKGGENKNPRGSAMTAF